MLFKYIHESSNRKLGPIPAVYSDRITCPDACPLKGRGCYGEHGAVSIHWRNVSLSFGQLVEKLNWIPENKLWRYAVVGDLPGENGAIDHAKVKTLANVNGSSRGFTYTHKPLTHSNKNIINWVNEHTRFTINLSADSLKDADRKSSLGIAPVTVTVPSTQKLDMRTPGGIKVSICPATYNKNISCSNCRVCWYKNRDFVVGFPAHGTRKRMIDERLKNKQR